MLFWAEIPPNPSWGFSMKFLKFQRFSIHVSGKKELANFGPSPW